MAPTGEAPRPAGTQRHRHRLPPPSRRPHGAAPDGRVTAGPGPQHVEAYLHVPGAGREDGEADHVGPRRLGHRDGVVGGELGQDRVGAGPHLGARLAGRVGDAGEHGGDEEGRQHRARLDRHRPPHGSLGGGPAPAVEVGGAGGGHGDGEGRLGQHGAPVVGGRELRRAGQSQGGVEGPRHHHHARRSDGEGRQGGQHGAGPAPRAQGGDHGEAPHPGGQQVGGERHGGQERQGPGGGVAGGGLGPHRGDGGGGHQRDGGAGQGQGRGGDGQADEAAAPRARRRRSPMGERPRSGIGMGPGGVPFRYQSGGRHRRSGAGRRASTARYPPRATRNTANQVRLRPGTK